MPASGREGGRRARARLAVAGAGAKIGGAGAVDEAGKKDSR